MSHSVFRELSADPDCKTPENSPLLITLSRRMKQSVDQIRALSSDGGTPEKTRKSTLEDTILSSRPLRGFLKKKGEKGLVKGWKTRFFVQKETKLHYFEKEADVEPLGFIDLAAMQAVEIESKQIFHIKVKIDASKTRLYQLQTKNGDETQYWVKGLTAILNRQNIEQAKMDMKQAEVNKMAADKFKELDQRSRYSTPPEPTDGSDAGSRRMLDASSQSAQPLPRFDGSASRSPSQGQLQSPQASSSPGTPSASPKRNTGPVPTPTPEQGGQAEGGSSEGAGEGETIAPSYPVPESLEPAPVTADQAVTIAPSPAEDEGRDRANTDAIMREAEKEARQQDPSAAAPATTATPAPAPDTAPAPVAADTAQQAEAAKKEEERREAERLAKEQEQIRQKNLEKERLESEKKAEEQRRAEQERKEAEQKKNERKTEETNRRIRADTDARNREEQKRREDEQRREEERRKEEQRQKEEQHRKEERRLEEEKKKEEERKKEEARRWEEEQKKQQDDKRKAEEKAKADQDARNRSQGSTANNRLSMAPNSANSQQAAPASSGELQAAKNLIEQLRKELAESKAAAAKQNNGSSPPPDMATLARLASLENENQSLRQQLAARTEELRVAASATEQREREIQNLEEEGRQREALLRAQQQPKGRPLDEAEAKMAAHQEHCRILEREIERTRNSLLAQLSAKDETVTTLQEEVAELKNMLQDARRRLAVQDRSVVAQLEEELSDLKKEYFHALFVSLKLHAFREERPVQRDQWELYDRIHLDNLPLAQWPGWLAAQFQSS